MGRYMLIMFACDIGLAPSQAHTELGVRCAYTSQLVRFQEKSNCLRPNKTISLGLALMCGLA